MTNPTPRPDLSTIIVTYNSSQVIGACLQSIIAQTGVAQEIWVVDNGSQDETLALVGQYPQVRVLSGHGNVGFAQGNNLGFAQAHGRYFFMLNPDTEVRAGALQQLVSFADAHPSAGMVAPKLCNPDGTLQHNTFRFPNYAQAFFGFFERFVPLDDPRNGRYLPQDYAQARPAEHILGAAVLIRREVWEALGGMDAHFKLYFEETDWCYRVKQAGWQLLFTPHAEVMHIGAHSTHKNPERASTLFYQSQGYFYRKNYGGWVYAGLKAIQVLGVSYWTARTVWGFLRKRVDSATLQKRLSSYRHILGS
jgi:GT2 family glycosyltransferase